MIFKEKTKTVPITKMMVWEAYKQVRSNKGSAGIDRQTLAGFEKNRAKELYKIWNRLASGSYFPCNVKRVNIPKGGGKTRPLGIPTVSDRIAQQVVKNYIEPRLDAVFVENSYGYRPNKSAHQAVKEVQKNVRKYSWVIDLDIQEFFENVSHELLFKALERHVTEKWVLMYIKRWVEAPIELENGTLVHPLGKGTPQGGVTCLATSNHDSFCTVSMYVGRLWLSLFFQDRLKKLRRHSFFQLGIRFSVLICHLGNCIFQPLIFLSCFWVLSQVIPEEQVPFQLIAIHPTYV